MSLLLARRGTLARRAAGGGGGGGGGTYESEVLADSPTGYWRLGESSGTTAADSSGNSNDGTYVGSPTLGATGATSDGNTAVEFDGTNHVTVDDVASMFESSTWAIAVWVKLTSTDTAHVFGAGRNSTDAHSFAVVTVNGPNTSAWRLAFSDGGAVQTVAYSGSAVFRDGDWHQLAVVKDGTAVTLYEDGVEVASGTVTGDPTGLDRATIGAFRHGGETKLPFTGTLDEGSVGPTALSADRIRERYLAALDIDPPTLPATRTFDTTAYDGAVDWIGTDGGQRTYVNPSTDAVHHPVTVSQSSDIDAARTADKAIDHDPTDGGNESHTDDTSSTPWWQIDFGGLRVEVDHYGIQGRDGNANQAPRNWKLQGSQDGSSWTDLDTQSSNTSIGDGTWFDGSVANATSWRYLRIQMTGDNSSGNDFLVMGEVEFWGTISEA